MALSRVQYQQTVSGNRDFSVTMSYISRDHIKVSVDGNPVTFEWLNTNTIKLAEAPEIGTVVDIKRETERNRLLVNFQDASTITEDQLDLSARQSFYLAQEAFDLTSSTLAVADDGSYSASGRRLSLLGEPDSDDDAVNRGWVQTQYTSGYNAYNERLLAEAARERATEAESNAVISENNATISEANAATSATNAAASEAVVAAKEVEFTQFGIATQEETQEGTNDVKAITPLKLNSWWNAFNIASAAYLDAGEESGEVAKIGDPSITGNTAVVVSTGSNAYGKWRRWSDGSIEQWGVATFPQETNNHILYVTLPVPMPNTDYLVLVTSFGDDTGEGGEVHTGIQSRYTTQISIHAIRHAGNGVGQPVFAHWYIKS